MIVRTPLVCVCAGFNVAQCLGRGGLRGVLGPGPEAHGYWVGGWPTRWPTRWQSRNKRDGVEAVYESSVATLGKLARDPSSW